MLKVLIQCQKEQMTSEEVKGQRPGGVKVTTLGGTETMVITLTLEGIKPMRWSLGEGIILKLRVTITRGTQGEVKLGMSMAIMYRTLVVMKVGIMTPTTVLQGLIIMIHVQVGPSLGTGQKTPTEVQVPPR